MSKPNKPSNHSLNLTTTRSTSSSSSSKANNRSSSLLIDFLPRLLSILILIISSIILITLSINSIPFLRLPTSLSVVNSQIADLKTYAQASNYQFLHLTTILSLIFIFKQSFSIPGTVLLNILIGAIYGTWLATLITCFLTAIGSTCAYQIARSIRPIILRVFPGPLKTIERAVERFKIPGSVDHYDTLQLSSYLLIARLLPIVPYAALNLASGVLELPLVPFFWTLVIGSFPYNFLTTQLGDILAAAAGEASANGSTMGSQPGFSQIWSRTLLLKLMTISMIGTLPVLFKEQVWMWLNNLTQSGARFKKTARFEQLRLRGWVSDVGARRKSGDELPIIDLLSPVQSINDDDAQLFDLSRSSSLSSLSTQEEPKTIFINLGPEPCFSSTSNPLPPPPPRHHHHPVSINQLESFPKLYLHPSPSLAGIQSPFDLPYHKVARILPSHLPPSFG